MSRLRICAAAVAVIAGVAFAASPSPRQAALSWTAPTQDVEGNAISGLTYNVYRGAKGTTLAQKTRIVTGTSVLSYVDSGRPAGVEECYNVTAFNGLESGPSAEGCKSYPGLAPAAPTLTVQ